ncbi:MAG: efflux RND transporter periplasmic adaptor subunit [Hyphomicrobium sp.]
MKRWVGYLFSLAIPLVLAGAAIAWFLNIGPGALKLGGLGLGSSAQITYETQPVSRGTIRKIISTSGPVRALVTVSVGSELSGLVDAVKVDFNSTVKKGDVLATIDQRTFSAKVAQSRADLAAADAALVNQQAAQVKAEAVLRLAEHTISRQRPLVQKGVSPVSALDNATRDMEVGRADVNVAKALIESAKATIAQRQAQLRQSEIDLERTQIKAPIEGTVISRSVDPGQTVASSFQAPELFKIAQDLSRIRIEAQVNEADVGAIETGNPVTFTVDAYPDRQFEGRVTQVRLAATEINNVVTYTVIIEAANDDRKLFPGMTANVQIEAAKRENVLRVPNDVLRYKPKAAAEQQGGHGSGEGGDRTARMIERLKAEVALTPEQETALRVAMALLSEEMKASARSGTMGAPPIDFGAMRQRMTARVEQTLGPLLTPGQRPMYERYKRGREGTRGSNVWVLDATGEPAPRYMRLGLTDDQFTEIIGGDIAEGTNIVARARELTK